MGEVLSITQEDWAEGVNTSLEEDRLPENASPLGFNSMFVGVGSGRVAIRRRFGCAIGNVTPITGTPAIIGQYAYKTISSGTTTQYHLMVSDGGRLDKLSAGTASAAAAATPSPFTAGTYYPDFATVNNLCFFANGVDLKKFDGTTVTSFGITRPTVGAMAGAVGAAGSPNGTYELRVTYYNSATGHESSASDTATATVTATSDKIDVTAVPVSSDAQVTHRYIYVRNTATMSVFYRAGTIADNTSTTITLDFTDASLITQAPDTAENDPPPATIRYLERHQSRLFAADDTKLYYSKIEKPEAFDPESYEPINPNDGQRITGIIAAFECLIIFKTKSVYGLFGEPGNWELRILVPDTGCESFRTIVAAEGALYWLSSTGLIRMASLGQVEALGQIFLARTFSPDSLNIAYFGGACATVDSINAQILVSVPEVLQTRNTRIIPFNYHVGRFCSSKWDPFDVASMAVIDDETSIRPWVYFGGYEGQVFKFGTGYLDGVDEDTTYEGTLTSSGSTTTFSDSTATFDTTGGGLVERTVIFIGPVNETVRRRITANTATQLTITPAALTVTTGWTYVIGSPDWQWETGWLLAQPRFWKKRFKHAYALLDANATIYIDTFLEFASSSSQTLSFSASSGGALWGAFLWGIDVWGSSRPLAHARLRIGRTASAIKLRIRSRSPIQEITCYALGVAGEVKSDRLH